MPPLKFNPDAFTEKLTRSQLAGPDGIQMQYEPSLKKGQKLLVVTGSNASGKSLLRRIITSWLHRDHKIEIMDLSLEKRTGADFSSAICNAMIFGDESSQATGVNSARTVTTGITTCKSRDHDHAILWDEPDLGLSDEYSLDLGARIAQFSQEDGKTVLITVVTHSRCLLRELERVNPHHLHLGEPIPDHPHANNLQAWIHRTPARRSVEDLYAKSGVLFRAIQERLNKARQKTNAQ